MTDIGSAGGADGKLRRLSRTVDSLERQVGKARIPRIVSALTRPLASRLQPGVRLFDSGLGRSLVVKGDQSGFSAEGMIQVAELANLPANPPEGLMVRVGNVGLHLVFNGLNWQLAAHTTWVRDIATRNYLSANGLVQAGYRVYVAADNMTYRFDGSTWFTPGVSSRDLDYGVMKAAGRDGRPMDAPGQMTSDGTINGDWNAVLEPGMYRIWAGNANGNMPANSYPYGTLVVFGAGGSIASRTQVYYPHQPNMNAQPYTRTAWNSNDWQPWGRAAGHLDIADMAYQPNIRNWDGDWFTRCSRDGNTGSTTVGISTNAGTTMGDGKQLFIIPEGYRPFANFSARARVYVGSQGGSAWSDQWYATLYFYRTGPVVLGPSNPSSMGSDCLITGSWAYPVA